VADKNEFMSFLSVTYHQILQIPLLIRVWWVRDGLWQMRMISHLSLF